MSPRTPIRPLQLSIVSLDLPIRSERLEVLREIVEQSLKDRDFRITAAQVGYIIYGPRWHEHPDHNNMLQYHSIILDSLVSSGDLSHTSISYAIEPQALATIAFSEEEDRRHNDLVRQQKILGLLTFALVLVGIVQIIVNSYNP